MRLVGPKGQSGRVWKISPPPGFDPWTVQPILILYTEYANLAHVVVVECKFYDEESHRFHLHGMLHNQTGDLCPYHNVVAFLLLV
jgi:hypothetical protein